MDYRLFWSMFMHKGVAHLLINLLSQIQILWIIEPDWGFIRTFLLYFISGLGSSITSASLDPCFITIGSSGALYGLYGGLLPYIIEYWVTLPYPIFLIIFLIISIIIGVLMGFTQNIDNYAHLGGCIFGLLWGFSTIRSISIFDACTIYENIMLTKPFSWCLTQNYIDKLKITRGIKQNLKGKNVKFSDETRSKFDFIFKRMEKNGTSVFKNRLREWIVRIISITLLLIISLVMTLLLFEEKMYSKFKPWGQMKFSGFAKCTCCYIKPEKLQRLQLPVNAFWCFDDSDAANNLCQLQSGLDGGVINTTKAAALHLLGYLT